MHRTTQWLNANRYRRFPFVEDTNMSLTGGIELPMGALLDIACAEYATSFRALYFKQVEITSGAMPEAVFTFEFAGAGVFVVTIPASAAFPYHTTISNVLARMVTLTFGEDVLELFDAGAGTYESVDGMQIEPALIQFQDNHRVEFVYADAPGSVWLLEDISCREGRNCIIRVSPATNTVYVTAVRGAGRGRSCDESTDDDNLTCGEATLYINGQHANNLGEFRILGGPAVEIESDPDNNEIRIRQTRERDDMGSCG